MLLRSKGAISRNTLPTSTESCENLRSDAYMYPIPESKAMN